MSHQTGIQVNDELREFISKCKNSKHVRVIKIAIINEQLALDEYKEAIGNWEDDYKKYVKKLVSTGQPCYLLFRLDTLDNCDNYHWLFISWSPENSAVRQKMLYASTKATLKLQFGSGSIAYDYFAATEEELSWTSYIDWLRKKKNVEERGDEAPLTREEQELKTVKRDEAISSCISKMNLTLPGVEFPINDDAINALFDLREGMVNYVQLGIEIKEEKIKLEKSISSNEFDLNKLRSLIPKSSARYHLIVFPHVHEGKSVKSVIFVYSVPGTSCSVKERMLYSSCKSALLNVISDERKLGINIDKKVEIDDPNELTPEFLLDELHPKINSVKTQFSKPTGPAGKRGGKRLIRTADE